MDIRILIATAVCALSSPAYAQTASVCPDNFDAHAGTSEPVSCTCSAEATKKTAPSGPELRMDTSDHHDD
jgi:hypothetical protein